jgi:hypothetical protein
VRAVGRGPCAPAAEAALATEPETWAAIPGFLRGGGSEALNNTSGSIINSAEASKVGIRDESGVEVSAPEGLADPAGVADPEGPGDPPAIADPAAMADPDATPTSDAAVLVAPDEPGELTGAPGAASPSNGSINAPCERRSSSALGASFDDAANAACAAADEADDEAGEAGPPIPSGSSTGRSANGSKTGRDAASIM